MNELETLKKRADELQAKSMIYFNELGDAVAYERLQNELKTINERILDLMTVEQAEWAKKAVIA